MQKISPYLWFDHQAEEAMNFYTSIFERSKIVSIERYPDGPLEGVMKGMEGRVLNGIFELDGQQFMALDAGPVFKFNPAVSFFVNASSEEEVNKVWEKLSEGGMALMPLDSYPFSQKFGWLMDKYGVSWQINLGARQQKITPALMFVGEQLGKAEEAMRLYSSLFNDSGIESLQRNEDGSLVQHAIFRLAGQEFMAMDSAEAHQFTFNEAISLYVSCESQEEVDHFWYQLSAHPGSEQCGWLKDKFGVSWQIVPTALQRLMSDPDPVKSKRVIDAMLQMKKIDILELEKAHAG